MTQFPYQKALEVIKLFYEKLHKSPTNYCVCKYTLKLSCSSAIFKNVWVWEVMVNEVRVIGASLY